MSGICGYINLDKKPVTDGRVVKEMADAISHRGPDGEGFFTRDNVALGSRRLSSIGERGEAQPMFNSDKALTMLYDGEAYNFRELKEILSAKGYSFNTASDTEVVLAAFSEWECGAFEKINGTFSLAVWDEKKKRLILARDGLGTKPLYYATFGNVFIFASEIKSILKHPAAKRETDVKGMLKYFAHDYIPNPSTIFKGIYKLEPGFYAAISKEGNLEKKKYWDIKFDESRKESDIAEYESDFRRLLKESVKRRLIGGLPIGVLLSGGLDSSSIVAMMAELEPSKPVKTFTIGFKEKAFDESQDAGLVAKYFKTDHSVLTIGAGEMLDVLPDILSVLDEPFADYSIIPTYCVSKFAKKRVGVVLGGDGGDEFFAGYNSYTAHKLSRILKNVPLSASLISAASRVAGGKSSYMSTGFKLRRYTRGLSYPESIRHQVWIGSFPTRDLAELLTEDFRKYAKNEFLYDESYRYMESTENLNYINRINYLYAKTYLADDGLPKVDRASQAAGLAARAPFLDNDFIKFAVSIPVNLKLKGFTNKYIIKRAMKDRLPAEILHKPKHGFAAPVGQWFKKGLKGLLSEVFEKGKIEREGIFNFKRIDFIMKSHLSGKIDYSRELWSLFIFEMWRKRWL